MRVFPQRFRARMSRAAASGLAYIRRPLPVAVLLLLALVSGTVAGLLHGHVRGWWTWKVQTRHVDPAAMRIESGKCWVVWLGTTWMSSHERPSPARLREDGKDLGPANAIGQSIITHGGGRFSFWNGALYFSSSDGTDPSANGRRYETVWPTPVSDKLRYVCNAVALLFAVLAMFVVGLGLMESVHFLRRPFPVAVLLFLALASGTAAVLLHGHVQGWWAWSFETRPLEPATMLNDSGKSWIVDLGTTWMSSHERPAPARLRENGMELGPGNANHEWIRTKGGGEFNLWKGTLYFSSSDGSDPPVNGRRYEIVWPTPVSDGLRYACNVLAFVLAALAMIVVSGMEWVRSSLAPWIDGLGARFRARGGRGAWQVAAVVAVVAILVRAVAFVLVQRDVASHISGLLVMGVPFSDAKGWDDLGESILLGHGLEGAWSARRPFYAFVLGALYTWTGPSPFAVVIMQILLGGLTAALVCRIGQRVLRPAVGAVAGLAFAFDPISVEYSHLVATETLGTFLFVLSLHQLVVALQENRASSSWWAGVAFALSNLTRTLTLLALPLLAGATVLMGHRRAGSWRRGCVLAALFCLGFGLPLGAWIVRQKIVHDLTTISDNTASGLYAAASPKHRSWTSAVDVEADDAGVPGGIKPRYEWFMRRFREEVAANPGFYLRNAMASGTDALRTLALQPASVRCLLIALLVGAWLVRIPSFVRQGRSLLPWILALVLVAAGLLALPPPALLGLAGLGLVVAAIRVRSRLAFLLLAGFVGTVVAVALFALGGDPRLLQMVSWMLPLGQAMAVVLLMGLSDRSLVPGVVAGASPQLAGSDPAFAPRWQRPLVTAGLVVLGCNLLFVAYRNFVAPVPPSALPLLSVEAAQTALRRLEQLRPGAITTAEATAPTAWYLPANTAADELQANDGRLVVAHARLTRHRYPVQGGLKVAHWSRIFLPRPYDRLYTFATATLLPGGGNGPGCIVLTSPLPKATDRDFLLIGRANVDCRYTYEENYLEVLAWAPIGPGGEADLSQLHFTEVPAHEQFVRSLPR